MYADDSFHTLTRPEQFGLIVLSATLAAVLLVASWRTMTKRRAITRAAIAACLFYLFVWLSPQAYYAYYLILFDGLIWQNVIKPPPPLWSILEILTFQGPVTLSAHFKGLLGWALTILALVTPRLEQDRGRP